MIFVFYSNKDKVLEYENKLNGKIIFILGNHDKSNLIRCSINKCYLKMFNLNILLVHDYLEVEDFNVDLILCGHVHSNWLVKKINNITVLNVGVDINKYMPLSAKEVYKYYNYFKKEYINKDKKNIPG